MLNTAYDEGQRPPVPDSSRVRAHEDTGLFFGAPDVDAVYAHLRDCGVDGQGAEGCALRHEATLRTRP